MEFYCLELVFLYTGPKTQTEICKNEDTIFWLDNAGLVAGVAAAAVNCPILRTMHRFYPGLISPAWPPDAGILVGSPC